MKKNGVYLLLFIAININFISFISRNFPLNIKEDMSVSPSSEPYQLFLPIVFNGLAGYFVSPNGNDTNPGTFYQPWKTIGKAAQMASAGDTVYIREGIYNESVHFETSGTASSPIRIMAYPGENPIIDGNFTIPGPWGSLLIVKGDYIYVSGLEVRNSAAMCVIVFGNFDLVDNLYVHHCKENGILITQGHNSTVQNSRVWRNALSNEYGNGNGWSSGLSAARSGVSYATISHNEVWENWGEGISSFEADQVVIEDNIVHDNYSANVYISDSTNVLFQRNFVYTDPTSYVFPYGDKVGIMMGDEVYDPSSANITVINNISFGNHGNFWWWQGVQGGGMDNVVIANNTFVNGIGDPNHGEGGVIISGGDHENVRFENNIVQQDDDLPVIATGPLPGVTYSHNLWSKPPFDAASGSGDIIADPQLSQTGDSFSPEWFRPTVLSPAIDHALSIPEILDDFFRVTRDSLPDMGAIEYLPE